MTQVQKAVLTLGYFQTTLEMNVNGDSTKQLIKITNNRNLHTLLVMYADYYAYT